MSTIFQIVLIALCSLAELVLGWIVIKRLLSIIATKIGAESISIYDLPSPLVLSYLFGLLIHLLAAFFLKLCGISWPIATLLPLLSIAFDRDLIREPLRYFSIPINLNFLIWFFVIIVLGISLFEATSAVTTIWVNNYGDLPFHIGMISSFTIGQNFPPEYHIFPGERLSYPFLINFWSALCWWPNPTLQSLHLIFLIQWTILWCLVYRSLDGDRYILLPWAVLLGGATYFTLGAHSGELIRKGYPWSSFLTTIWVTQRGALFGAAIALSALRLFHLQLGNNSENKRFTFLILCGLLLSLSPLAHAHIFLVTTLYIGVSLAFRSCLDSIQSKVKPTSLIKSFYPLMLFGFSLILTLLALPWLTGKTGIIQFSSGWMPVQLIGQHGISASIFNSTAMWLMNAGQWFVFWSALWILSQRHVEMVVLLALFLLANFVQIARWDWDQIKIFLGIYLIIVSLWSTRSDRLAWSCHVLAILLIIPGFYELKTVLSEYKKPTIYSDEDLKFGAGIKELTAPDAIILAAPDHNSPVTLTGRRLFLGYEGTLSSHGIDYQERLKIIRDFNQVINCKDQLNQACPQYLIWSQRERNYWRAIDPTRFQQLKRTSLANLWKFERK